MINPRIVLQGRLDKEPKIKEDGSVDIIFEKEFDETSRKDIKKKVKTVYLIKLTKHQYKISKKNLKKEDMEFRIIGEATAAVTKKGRPYIYVSVSNISFIHLTESNTKSNKVKSVLKEIDGNSKKQWWQLLEPTDFVVMSPYNVVAPESYADIGSTYVNIKDTLNKPMYIAVNETEDGKYKLLAGIKTLMVAKAFNKNVRAYVTDIDRKAFERDLWIK